MLVHFKSLLAHVRAVRVVTLVALFLVVLIVLAGCGRKQEADDEYDQAIAQIEEIHQALSATELYELGPEDLQWLEDEFLTLSERVERMNELSSLPLGMGNVAEFGSARYRSTIQMLEVAGLLAESGQIIASVGNESLVALEDTGIRFDPDNTEETWLDVLQRRDSEIDIALDLMQDALIKREQIDESELPGRVYGNLAKIDELIEEVEHQLELAEQRAVAYESFGGEGNRRYLVLFQNPAELRPTGGFVGTIAEVELLNGQIFWYEFQDVYHLSQAYRQSDHEVEPPAGIAQFVRTDKLQFQDANWWAHFPTSASLMLEMSEAAGVEPFDGVAAIQPEAIQDMLASTGSITVEVDGAEREITSENLFDEAERQRREARQGNESETDHKDVIGVIGEVLFDELSNGDREDLIPVVLAMFDRLDQRDMQAFHVDSDVQELLEERNWAGLIDPEPDIPSLAITFSNVTGLKTSLAMQPSVDLVLDDEATDGSVEATLTVSLAHLGSTTGDPFYEGFQRYWVDIHLPDGSAVLDRQGRTGDDPEAGSGGAFIVNLDIGEIRDVTVQFTMPVQEQLLIRRQPGLVTSEVTLRRSGCNVPLEFVQDRDYIIEMNSTCPQLLIDDDD